MALVCDGCGQFVEPAVDAVSQTIPCPQCGYKESRRILPLFIVTGASGTGKTAVVRELRGLLPEWDVFETDILWDSGGNWDTVKCNWLRIAHSIAQSGRPTILCGTILPETVDKCDHRSYFSRVYYLNLHCDDETRDARLRARPAWRGCTEEFIAEHKKFARWLLENARTAFNPPLETVDSTHISIVETARQIRDWAIRHRDEEARD